MTETYILVKLIGTEVNNRLVVAACIEHKDMAAPDMNKGLRDPRPHFGIVPQVALNRLDRALNVILQDRDTVRDRGLDQLLGQPGFQQPTDHIRLGVAMGSQMRNLQCRSTKKSDDKLH